MSVPVDVSLNALSYFLLSLHGAVGVDVAARALPTALHLYNSWCAHPQAPSSVYCQPRVQRLTVRVLRECIMSAVGASDITEAEIRGITQGMLQLVGSGLLGWHQCVALQAAAAAAEQQEEVLQQQRKSKHEAAAAAVAKATATAAAAVASAGATTPGPAVMTAAAEAAAKAFLDRETMCRHAVPTSTSHKSTEPPERGDNGWALLVYNHLGLPAEEFASKTRTPIVSALGKPDSAAKRSMAWPDRGWESPEEFDGWRQAGVERSGIAAVMKSRPVRDCIHIASRLAVDGLVTFVCTDSELADLCGMALGPVPTASVHTSKLTGRRARTLAELDSLVKNHALANVRPSFRDSFVARGQLAFELVTLYRGVLCGRSPLTSSSSLSSSALSTLPRVPVGALNAALSSGVQLWRRVATSCVAASFAHLATMPSSSQLPAASDGQLLQSLGALFVVGSAVEALRPGARVVLTHRSCVGTVTAYDDGGANVQVLVDGECAVVDVQPGQVQPVPALPPPPEATLVKLLAGGAGKEAYDEQCEYVVGSLAVFLVNNASVVVEAPSWATASTSDSGLQSMLRYAALAVHTQAMALLWSLASTSVPCLKLVGAHTELQRLFQVQRLLSLHVMMRLRLVLTPHTCLSLVFDQTESTALSTHDAAAASTDDPAAAESALWSSRFQFSQSLQQALRAHEAGAVFLSRRKPGAVSPPPLVSSFQLPTIVSTSSMDGCCFGDCSGRRVVHVRDAGESSVVLANRAVPLVLTSYFFEVCPTASVLPRSSIPLCRCCRLCACVECVRSVCV
jgi:hypothetical protein